MKKFLLKRSLWIPQPIEKVFSFFSNPETIPRITPKWVHFENVGNGRQEIQLGSRLVHRIKMKGVPIRWESEITEWDPPYGFVDEQRKGPYRHWRHEHLFEEKRGGTCVEDVIHYAVLGGEFVNRIFVAPELKRIFDYRYDIIPRVFP